MTFLTSVRFNGQIPNFAGPIFLSTKFLASLLTSVTCPAPTDPIGSKLTPNVTCSLAREGEDIAKDRSTGLKLGQVWSFQSKLRPGWMPSQSPRVPEKQVFQGASTLVNPHHPPSCLPCIWDYIEDSLITWFWSRPITCSWLHFVCFFPSEFVENIFKDELVCATSKLFGLSRWKSVLICKINKIDGPSSISPLNIRRSGSWKLHHPSTMWAEKAW